MKLLTQKLRRRLPPLYSQENTKDPIVSILEFFHTPVVPPDDAGGPHHTVLRIGAGQVGRQLLKFLLAFLERQRQQAMALWAKR